MKASQWRAYATTFIFMTGAWASGLAVTLQVPDLGGSAADAGSIIAIRFLVAGLLSLSMGYAVDALGAGRTIKVAVIVTASSNVLPLLAHTTQSPALLYAWAFVSGITVAAFWPAISAEIAEVTPRDRRGAAFGNLAFAMYSAVAAGPALAGLLWDSAGMTATYGASGAICLAALLLGSTRTRVRDAALPTSAYQVLLDVGRRRSIWGSWIGAFAIGIPQGATVGLFPLFGQQGVGLSAATIGVLLGIQSIAHAGARLLLGHAIDRWLVPSVAIGGAAAAYGAVTLLLGIQDTAVGAGLVLAIGMIPLAMGLVLAQVLIVENLRPEVRATALGGYGSAVFLGAAAGPAIGGTIADAAGFGLGFAGVGSLAIVFAGASVILLSSVPRLRE